MELRQTRVKLHSGFIVHCTTSLIVSFYFSMAVGMSIKDIEACQYRIDLILTIYYFAMELSLLTMLMSFFTPLKMNEHYFIGRSGLFAALTFTATAIGNLAIMIKFHTNCRDLISTGVSTLYWIATILSFVALILLSIFLLIILCIGRANISTFFARRSLLRRQIKYHCLLASKLHKTINTRVLTRETLTIWLEYVSKHSLRNKEEYLYYHIVFQVLFTSVYNAASSPGLSCSICLQAYVDKDRIVRMPECCHLYHLQCYLTSIVKAVVCHECHNTTLIHGKVINALNKMMEDKSKN